MKSFIKFLVIPTLLLLLLSSCVSSPTAIYRGHNEAELPETSLAIVKWERSDWAKFNDVLVDGGTYSGIQLLPGTYQIELEQTTSYKTTLYTFKHVSEIVRGTVVLDAGRTYRINAEKWSSNPGYTDCWISDNQDKVVDHFPSQIIKGDMTKYRKKVYVPQEVSENISPEQRKTISPAIWKDDFILKITKKYPEFDPLVNTQTQGISMSRYTRPERLCLELELRFAGEPLKNAEEILSYGASILERELPKYY